MGFIKGIFFSEISFASSPREDLYALPELEEVVSVKSFIEQIF